MKTQQQKLDAAIDILTDICENWNEDAVLDYPASLPSFDEIIAGLNSISFIERNPETVASVRAMFVKNITAAADESKDAEFIVMQEAALNSAKAIGFDWETAPLSDAFTLADYCLKATSPECAAATLQAFDKWVASLAKIQGK
jgi:hypothetical protein